MVRHPHLWLPQSQWMCHFLWQHKSHTNGATLTKHVPSSACFSGPHVTIHNASSLSKERERWERSEIRKDLCDLSYFTSIQDVFRQCPCFWLWDRLVVVAVFYLLLVVTSFLMGQWDWLTERSFFSGRQSIPSVDDVGTCCRHSKNSMIVMMWCLLAPVPVCMVGLVFRWLIAFKLHKYLFNSQKESACVVWNF